MIDQQPHDRAAMPWMHAVLGLAFAVALALAPGCGSDDSTGTSSSGTVAFRIKPNWGPEDPSTRAILRLETTDDTGSAQIFKNGIYLRFLFIDRSGLETNSSVNLTNPPPPGPFWEAGQWHHVAVTWSDSILRIYLDGGGPAEGPYAGDLPSATALAAGSERPNGEPNADAQLTNFVYVDRALSPAEIRDLAGE